MNRLVFFCDPAEFANREIAIGAAEELRPAGSWFLRMYWPKQPEKAAEWTRAMRLLQPQAILFNAPLPVGPIRAALRRRIPCVAVASDAAPQAPVPLVMEDLEGEGLKAADFFLQSGMRHFACLDLKGPDALRGKSRGYRRRLREAGLPCHELTLQRTGETYVEMFGPFNPMRVMGPWLNDLPKPCALLATSDALASETVEICIRSGLRVPEDIAILGMDNNPVLCHTCNPPLSSVRTAFREIGRTAGRLVLTWDWRRPAQRVVHAIPPIDIVERSSTRPGESGHPTVRRVMEFIDRNIGEPFPINALARHCDISPQALAQHFRKTFGHPPVVEVSRRRIVHARHLLEESNLPVHEVASRCGFRSAIRFCAVFRQQAGMTPMQYRHKVHNS